LKEIDVLTGERPLEIVAASTEDGLALDGELMERCDVVIAEYRAVAISHRAFLGAAACARHDREILIGGRSFDHPTIASDPEALRVDEAGDHSLAETARGLDDAFVAPAHRVTSEQDAGKIGRDLSLHDDRNPWWSYDPCAVAIRERRFDVSRLAHGGDRFE
jgi:hypothetical protein